MEQGTEKLEASEDETSKKFLLGWDFVNIETTTENNLLFNYLTGRNAKSFMELVLRYKDAEIFSNKELSDEIITLITAVGIAESYS